MGPVAQRATLCGSKYPGTRIRRSRVQRPPPSPALGQGPRALLSAVPPRPSCTSPLLLQPSPITPTCLPQGLSRCGTPTPAIARNCQLLTHAHAELGDKGPQSWLYLEEARCHRACCHCIVGGHGPHHGAGGSCSALQGWGRREGWVRPLPASEFSPLHKQLVP